MAQENIKSFLKLGFAAGRVVEALGDGFQLSDLGAIISAAKAIPGGLAAAPAALGEYMAMDDAQAADLEAWAVAEFDLKNDTVEFAIEAVLKVVIELHGLAKFLKPKAA